MPEDGSTPIDPFDETVLPDGQPRPGLEQLAEWMVSASRNMLKGRQAEAETLFRRIGITFSVYAEGGDPERLIPFDIVPRILLAKEWEFLARGLRQRVQALNMFLEDVYTKGEILAAGRVPQNLVLLNKAYLPEMRGVPVAGGVYTHVAGIDLVRTGPEEIYVLEDNTRTPSGVSYMLQNREVMMRLFPDLFNSHAVAPVERYPEELLATMQSVAPPTCEGEPTVVVLSPGIYNSAHYEHTFLADQMGIELVEGPDLFVKDNRVYMRTTHGPQVVDVIYRRIDDAFIAQPTLAPSTCPTFVAEGYAPRHVDLRPFVLVGADGIRLTPGGFTRVALRHGSLVVNSSQGGGTKDTWVLNPDCAPAKRGSAHA